MAKTKWKIVCNRFPCGGLCCNACYFFAIIRKGNTCPRNRVFHCKPDVRFNGSCTMHRVPVRRWRIPNIQKKIYLAAPLSIWPCWTRNIYEVYWRAPISQNPPLPSFRSKIVPGNRSRLRKWACPMDVWQTAIFNMRCGSDLGSSTFAWPIWTWETICFPTAIWTLSYSIAPTWNDVCLTTPTFATVHFVIWKLKGKIVCRWKRPNWIHAP